MHFRTRTWLVVACLLCLLAAILIWRFADGTGGRQEAPPVSANNPATPQPPGATATPGGLTASATASLPTNPPVVIEPANATNRFRYRLSNTPQSVDSLARSDTGILLRNALIDSSAPLTLGIPPHLRAEGDPGSYVVQARGPITEAFRAQLLGAGLEIVSYVPNNAYR